MLIKPIQVTVPYIQIGLLVLVLCTVNMKGFFMFRRGVAVSAVLNTNLSTV